MWAIHMSIEVGIENFKASDRSLAYFKQKYKIKNLKVNHMITKSYAFPEFSLQTFIEYFR